MKDDWALFLDFDGTVVDIAESADAVDVPPRLPFLLDELSRLLGGALALVSGRKVAAIDAMLKPMRFHIAGVHGLEYRSGGRIRLCDPDSHADFRRGALELADHLGRLDGIVVEDKGCAIAVHWRLAPESGDLVLDALNNFVTELGPAYRLQCGKAVAEVLPAQYDKGQAIRSFMAEPPFFGRRPMFIGDDVTDEAGFRVVNALEGLSVRVGRGVTGARHFIGSPALMREQLARWASAGRISPEFEIAA
jgi:trehalose 6-phosphate phosphatase